jgi:hypothetical protein
MPLALIPTVGVPVMVSMHVVSLRQLVRTSREDSSTVTDRRYRWSTGTVYGSYEHYEH